MSTEFWIQAGCPRSTSPDQRSATTIDEAVEHLFLRETEDAIIVWRHVHIPLSYKYDVGTILTDVLTMVDTLLATDSGEWQVDWPANTFAARWRFAWNAGHLVVTATEWRSVVGDTEPLLRARSRLEIEKISFVCEWKMVLVRVHEALRDSVYASKDLGWATWLESTIGRIPAWGALYR